MNTNDSNYPDYSDNGQDNTNQDSSGDKKIKLPFINKNTPEHANDSENKHLVPISDRLPAIFNKDNNKITAMIVFSPLDDSHCSFSYQFDENVSFKMDEASNISSNDYVESEFYDDVPQSERIYYTAAMASGILTGALTFIDLTKEQREKIEKVKENDFKKIVIYAAQLLGFNKDEYKAASKYLFNHAINKIKSNDKAAEYLTVLASHPTIAGLVFSFLTQFSGELLCLSESGKLTKRKVSKEYFIGNTNSDKIIAAIMYWLFNLTVNQFNSKRNIIDDLGLPKALIQLFKSFINLPIFKDIPKDYAQAETAFSKWLRNTISGAVDDSDTEDGDANLVVNMMKIALNLSDDAFPVLINECVVRSLFIVLKICDIVKNENITTFDELQNISPDQILPQEGRVLSRMCLLSSGAFVAMNLSAATLRALRKKKSDERNFAEAFLSEINIAGVGRFVLACVADSKYWGDDIKAVFSRKSRSYKIEDSSYDWKYDESAFNPLSLDVMQTRMLYSLENLAVLYDIKNTSESDIAELKNNWLNEWRSGILLANNVPDEYHDSYFVEDENNIYSTIFEFSKNKNNYGWYYLLTQELALFKPYVPLCSENDSKYKKLKLKYDYVEDQFVRRQSIVSQAEVDDIKKSYESNKGYVSGNTQKLIATVVGTTAVTALTGGLALTFAPGIAAMVAGEAVVGLHGAALSSASLAFVGGGSLAAGGLGMAGGTAIITGGGALLGLAGTGGVSAVSFLFMVPKEYWVRQGAKLLTYCECTLLKTLNDRGSLSRIYYQVDKYLKETSEELAALKLEKNDLNDDYIKKLKDLISSLTKVHKKLNELLK